MFALQVKHSHKLQPIVPLTKPLSVLVLDHLEPLTRSNRKQYTLVCIDSTRQYKTRTTEKADSYTTTQIVLECIVSGFKEKEQ